MGSAPKTLKALRQNAPQQDRNEPPLVPTALPHWHTARDGSRYVAISIYPRTLDELRTMGRDFGEAAVTQARWDAIGVWLWKECPSPAGLRNPYTVASAAVDMMMGHDRYHLGFPRYDGAEWPTPALDGLTPECQHEVKRVAAETLADWAAAGSPWLDPSRIKTHYQLLTSSPAFRAKYIGADAGSTQSQDNT